MRLRKKDNRYFQTVKSGIGLQRNEVKIKISKEQFEKLWSLTEGMRIEKVRIEIDHSGLKIELDIYSGILDGLVVTKVEFPSIELTKSFIPLNWFDREVTKDESYNNRNLVLNGLPDDLFPNG